VSAGRDPAQAPRRADLTFLRHRAKPRPARPEPVPHSTIDMTRPPRPNRPPSTAPGSAAPGPAAQAAPRPDGSLDLSLDLSGPAPSTPPAAAPPAPGSATRPAASPLNTAPADLSLDLSASPVPRLPSAPSVPGAAPNPRPRSTRHRVAPVLAARRAPNGSVTRLGPGSPTVALSRIQSGIGGLEFALTRASAAGDLSLGCVYELDDGLESVVQALGERMTGPPGASLPLVRLKPRPDGAAITFDLRRVRSLRRALLYGYSPSGAALSWDGIIVTATHGGARIEIPLDHSSFDGTLAMVTVYNVEGELVLRAEMEPFPGPPERAAIGFGYAVPWLDGRVPAA
jgi:uncharacterized protein involved in tellurium resistance